MDTIDTGGFICTRSNLHFTRIICAKYNYIFISGSLKFGAPKVQVLTSDTLSVVYICKAWVCQWQWWYMSFIIVFPLLVLKQMIFFPCFPIKHYLWKLWTSRFRNHDSCGVICERLNLHLKSIFIAKYNYICIPF